MGRGAAGWAAASPLVPLDRRGDRARSRSRSPGRGAARSTSARTPGCVIGALFVLALVVLTAVFVVPAIVRGIRGSAGSDPAERLLALAVRGLPRDRRDWGLAMLGELDQADGRRARWRFSLGCAWAASRIRLRSPEPGGRGLRAVVVGCAAVSLALVGYGVVHYPGLRAEPNFAGAMVVFAMTLLVYVGLVVLLARGVSRESIAARRTGLAGGLATGAGWFLGIAPPTPLKGWVAVPLLIALVGPTLTATIAARRSGDSRSGSGTALWSGLIAGLVVFILWTTVTYADAGRPYDAGLVSDFHESGAHDLATYAISDNLGSGLVLLLLIPTVALAIGTLGARLANAARRT